MHSWMRWLSAWLENFLFYAVFVFIILIIMIQALMVRGDVRQYISLVDSLEGDLYSYTWDQNQEGDNIIYDSPAGAYGLEGEERVQGENDSSLSITFQVVFSDAPEDALHVLVNGEERGRLGDDLLTLQVKPDDLLTISAGSSAGTVKVEIVDTQGLQYPPAGVVINIKGSRQQLGRVVPQE